MLSKFFLLYLLAVVVVMFGLGIYFYPFENAFAFASFVGWMFVLVVVTSFPVATLQETLKRRNSAWLQPASGNLRDWLVNTVVLAWFLLVTLLLALALRQRGAFISVLIVAIFLAVGLVLGRYIRRGSRLSLMLSFALSSIAALFVVIFVVAAFGL